MNPTYSIPPDVCATTLHGQPALMTAQGGVIALDRKLYGLWRSAHRRRLEEIVSAFAQGNDDPVLVRAGLACLAEAGLLQRVEETSAGGGTPTLQTESLRCDAGANDESLVSAVIVAHNSQAWLSPCLQSLYTQTDISLEIIVVDNASTDGVTEWLLENHPNVRRVRLERAQSLAGALNHGLRIAKGEHILLLNPDVSLTPQAVKELVTTARKDPACAAVAAKLRFLWAPAFLNGIGNFVGPFSWGTDIALGHLDLGQFDSWQEVPSACFAATLIPAEAIPAVGLFDEAFPLYYEDSEWCYRARLLGYRVKLAAAAVVYHAFGGRVPAGEGAGLGARKLRQVVYGRLRFAVKLLGPAYLAGFLWAYFIEDCLNIVASLLLLRWQSFRAYLSAWGDFVRDLPTLAQERRIIQSRRVRSDRDLFRLQHSVPIVLVWRGVPQLTWDIVRYHYLPAMIAGQTRVLPELAPGVQLDSVPSSVAPQSLLLRAMSIWHSEGLSSLLRRFWRYTQGWLMRP